MSIKRCEKEVVDIYLDDLLPKVQEEVRKFLGEGQQLSIAEFSYMYEKVPLFSISRKGEK